MARRTSFLSWSRDWGNRPGQIPENQRSSRGCGAPWYPCLVWGSRSTLPPPQNMLPSPRGSAVTGCTLLGSRRPSSGMSRSRRPSSRPVPIPAREQPGRARHQRSNGEVCPRLRILPFLFCSTTQGFLLFYLSLDSPSQVPLLLRYSDSLPRLSHLGPAFSFLILHSRFLRFLSDSLGQPEPIPDSAPPSRFSCLSSYS